MYQETIRAASPDGYHTMAFSDRVKTLCAAPGHPLPPIRPAKVDEALIELARARSVLEGLAPDAVVATALAHNPEIFQLIEGEGGTQPNLGFLAFLPLNPRGARAIVEGRFSGSAPDLTMVCKSGEAPVALYIWLIFAPDALGPALRALAPLFARLAPDGCPIFTRAATRHTTRLFPAMGFIPAHLIYPSAPIDLLGLPPTAGFPRIEELCSADCSPVAVRVARTIEDVMKAFSIRSATYISEQECPFAEEFDGNDFCATHLIGEIDGEPAGCMRIRWFADFVKFERLAVRQEFRTSRLAFRLVREGISLSSRKGYKRAYGHSRRDLTRFWGLFGFEAMPDRHTFVFSDAEYVEMVADLKSAAAPIDIGTDPYVLIRPEGEWDKPGPLDRSTGRGMLFRSANSDERARLHGGGDSRNRTEVVNTVHAS